jgi:hypothetical protein
MFFWLEEFLFSYSIILLCGEQVKYLAVKFAFFGSAIDTPNVNIQD